MSLFNVRDFKRSDEKGVPERDIYIVYIVSDLPILMYENKKARPASSDN